MHIDCRTLMVECTGDRSYLLSVENCFWFFDSSEAQI